MTSFAFILGVLPLILSRGAGAEMRRTLGTAVFSGMLGVTMFGIVLTPVFFFTIDWLGETSIFNSRTVRRAGAVALGVTTLGVRWMVKALASPNGKKAEPAKALPGDQEGNGAVKEQGKGTKPPVQAGL
jgi:hypothetical protein